MNARAFLWLALLLVCVLPAGAADVRGTVFVAPGDKPLAGATVILTPPAGQPVATTTDARGRYAFTGQKPGRQTVVAGKQGFTAQRQTLTIAAATSVLGIYFRLAPWEAVPFSITGTVYREDGKIPLAGAQVRLHYEPMPARREQAGEMTTSETGFFAFTDLRPGRYVLRVTAEGYLPAPEKSFALQQGTDHQVADMTMLLPPPETIPGTVSGEIAFPDGAPAANTEARLWVEGQGTRTELPWGREVRLIHREVGAADAGASMLRAKLHGAVATDGAGRFRITLPPGTWSVKVWLKGHLAQTQAVVVPAGKAVAMAPVRLAAGEDPLEKAEAGRAAQAAPTPDTTLHGVILRPDGTPLANTGVYVFVGGGRAEPQPWSNEPAGLGQAYVVTDAQGRFRRKVQPLMGATDALVTAKTRGFAETEAVRVEMPPGGKADVSLRFAGPSTAVTGRVLSNEGKPVVRAVVYAYHLVGRWQNKAWWAFVNSQWHGEKHEAGPWRFDTPASALKPGVVAGLIAHGLSYAESGADGRFSLTELDTGVYHFGAALPGWARASRESITLRPGATTAMTLTLARLGSIEGVLAGHDGAPLPVTSVSITRTNTAEPDIAAQGVVRTDPEGRYRLADLSPGTYRLRFQMPGRPPLVRESVVVEPGKPTLGVDVRMQEGQILRGKALLPDGTPAAGASVTATQETGGRGERIPGVAGPDGTFTLSGLAPGVCRVRVRAPRQTVGAATVTLPQDAGALLEVRLPASVTVRGTLRDPAGAPVAGAQVSCFRPGVADNDEPGGDTTGRTNEAGEFRLAGLAPGEVIVQASKEGYRSASETRTLPAAGGEILLDLRTETLRYGRLRGRILKPGGAPAAQVRVRAWSSEFRFERIAAGWVRLRLEGVAPPRRPLQMEIAPDQETVFPDVTLAETGSVECVLRGHERLPKGTTLWVTPAAVAVAADGKPVPPSEAVRLFCPMTREFYEGIPRMARAFDVLTMTSSSAILAVYPPGARISFTLLDRVEPAQGRGDTLTLTGVPAGPCQVRAGYEQSVDDRGTVIFQPGVPVQVVANEKSRVVIEIQASGKVTGHLAGIDAGATRAMVGICRRDTWQMAGAAIPSAAGVFTAAGLVPGDYLAVIAHASVAGVLHPFTIRAGETTEIAPRLGAGVTLRGRVNGALPKSAFLSAESETGFGSAQVSADGTFTVEHLLPGTYTFRLWAPGEERIVTRAGVKVGKGGAEGVEIAWP